MIKKMGRIYFRVGASTLSDCKQFTPPPATTGPFTHNANYPKWLLYPEQRAVIWWGRTDNPALYYFTRSRILWMGLVAVCYQSNSGRS